MIKTSKQTPLTVESFKALLMPEINKQFGEVRGEIKSVRNDLTKLVHTVNDLKETVEETNKRVKFLPTTEVYLKSQDKLMKELKDSRDATALTGTHYKDTNDRIDKVDQFIGYNSLLQ